MPLPQPTPTSIKRIGLLTSGGDCSGLNAFIPAVVYRATQTYGWQVFGILRGTLGLMERMLMYEELSLSRFQGHMQRSGAPSAQNRIFAQTFGTRAVDLAAQGRFDRMVAWRGRGVVDVPLDEVVKHGERKVLVEGTHVRTARAFGIYVGEDPAQYKAESAS